MIKFKGTRSSNVFIIMLYVFFTLFAFIVLLLGSTLYQNINSAADETFAMRTSLSFVTTKVRQVPNTKNIKIDSEKIGVKSLVLEEVIDDSIYQTWIYHYNGSLYEMFINSEIDFVPEDGAKIVDIEKFDFNLNDMLELSATTKSGSTTSVSVALRSSIKKLGV